MFFIVFGNVFFQNAYAQSVVTEEQKILDAENLYIKINDFLKNNENCAPEDFEKVCCEYIKSKSEPITVLNEDDFISQSVGHQLLYRGFSEKHFAYDLKQGKVYIGSNAKNVRGNGIYTTSNEKCARLFAKKNGDCIVKLFFDNNSKILNNDYLKEIKKIMCERHPKEFDYILNSTKRDLCVSPLDDYLSKFLEGCKTNDEWFKKVNELKSMNDPVLQELRTKKIKYFKDKKAALFYNNGLLANFLGYDILYTNEFDNELGVDIQEYLILNYGVLKVCNN